MNIFNMALHSLLNNRTRSILTMLGITIGVTSVIVLLAIGEGTKNGVKSEISKMGMNMIIIQPGGDTRGGMMQDPSLMQTLKLDNYEAIRDECRYISAISPFVVYSGQLVKGANNYPSYVNGVSIDYLDIRQQSIDKGKMFTETDIQISAKVCVVGKTVIDNLFSPNEDPIGQIIRCNNVPIRIIGTLKEKGYNAMGQDQDNVILVPYTMVMKRLHVQNYISGIYASAADEKSTEKAVKSITDILRKEHRIKADDRDDFTIRTQQEVTNILGNVTSLITILLGCIAGISLIVGGIGIMNIMYVSVVERTREIGLRLSIGACKRDILLQFLMEAIFLSITAGILGIIIGCLGSILIKGITQWPVSILPWSIPLAFGVCTLTGVFFGWYPAKKASNMDPIEAIKYE